MRERSGPGFLSAFSDRLDQYARRKASDGKPAAALRAWRELARRQPSHLALVAAGWGAFLLRGSLGLRPLATLARSVAAAGATAFVLSLLPNASTCWRRISARSISCRLGKVPITSCPVMRR